MDNQIQAQYHEHHFKRIIPGDLESVRQRLASVLADFNYDVVNEQPLQARRTRTKNLLSATMLEQNTKLTIALKSLNSASTLATFDYSIQFLTTKGDCMTLEREADAIIAMAKVVDTLTVCPACNTKNSSSVRFCRVCGLPAGHNLLPAEIEIMKLTDNTRASYQEITLGVLVAFVTVLISLLITFLANPSAYKVTIWVSAIGSLISALLVLRGLRRLHLTLNPKNAEQNQAISNITRSFPDARSSDYLLETEAPSVTEGTTRMMDKSEKDSTIAQAKRSARTTDSME
jgi:hypothetical protein